MSSKRIFNTVKIIRPMLDIANQYSVLFEGRNMEFEDVELLADDEFDAVTKGLEETGWNIPGIITVDNAHTLKEDLEPLLQFIYEPQK
jgi:hypothetical protein